MNARASSELTTGVRQQNLSRVLRMLHSEGPLARSTLTERTGLNRSTIADLISQLSAWDLVNERDPGLARGVGRPSPIVEINPTTVSVAVHPEIDAVTLAAVGLDRTIVVRERIDLDHVASPEEVIALLTARLKTWQGAALRGARIVAIGVAVPGLVRARDGVVRDAPHLAWRDVPLQELITHATGIPTAVGNDASLGTLAEHHFGAARGVDNVIYLNGGASGIGGGLIVHGMPVSGAGGYAGEFGQNRPGIAFEASRAAPGGVLEDEVSRARLLAVVGLTSGDEPTLAAALAHSPAVHVHEELTRQRAILATALANAVNVLNPSVIVLGGFLATLATPDLQGLATAIAAQAMPACGENLEIRAASLADDRLLVGAAEIAFADLLGDPGP